MQAQWPWELTEIQGSKHYGGIRTTYYGSDQKDREVDTQL